MLTFYHRNVDVILTLYSTNLRHQLLLPGWAHLQCLVPMKSRLHWESFREHELSWVALNFFCVNIHKSSTSQLVLARLIKSACRGGYCVHASVENLNTRFLFTRSLCRFVRHVLRLRSSLLNLDAWDNENTFDSHAPTWAYGWYVRVVVRTVSSQWTGQNRSVGKSTFSTQKIIIQAWQRHHAPIFEPGALSQIVKCFWPSRATILYHIKAYIHGHRHPNLWSHHDCIRKGAIVHVNWEYFGSYGSGKHADQQMAWSNSNSRLISPPIWCSQLDLGSCTTHELIDQWPSAGLRLSDKTFKTSFISLVRA